MGFCCWVICNIMVSFLFRGYKFFILIVKFSLQRGIDALPGMTYFSAFLQTVSSGYSYPYYLVYDAINYIWIAVIWNRWYLLQYLSMDACRAISCYIFFCFVVSRFILLMVVSNINASILFSCLEFAHSTVY